MSTSIWFVPEPSWGTQIGYGLASLLADRYGAGVGLQLGGVILNERAIGWLDGIVAATKDSVLARDAIQLRDAIRQHGAVRLQADQQ